ncbi:hypothetical protein [Jiulongibacter sediminis]|uniref:hypothetical protein n=1 Tax=Jiulongibacter sediminis TaxID=1605367 RepID=UPI0026EED179|nr:hypothetical protein [Jiulongibacter sediminis]
MIKLKNRNIKKLALLIVTATFSMACSKTNLAPSQSFKVNESENLSFNYDSKNGSIDITEIQESRCPANANCIRAGEAIVTFNLKLGDKKLTDQKLCVQCESPFEIPEEMSFEVDNISYTLKLLDVTPFPTLDNSNETKQAEFELN